MIVIAGEYFIRRVVLAHYYSLPEDAFYTRCLMRGFTLPCIKYVWLHCIIVVTEIIDVPHKEEQFLVTTIPLALVTATGHSMSLASSSLLEGTLMEAITCIMEGGFECQCHIHCLFVAATPSRFTPSCSYPSMLPVFEYFCYLRGNAPAAPARSPRAACARVMARSDPPSPKPPAHTPHVPLSRRDPHHAVSAASEFDGRRAPIRQLPNDEEVRELRGRRTRCGRSRPRWGWGRGRRW